jgi:hypothetical protein
MVLCEYYINGHVMNVVRSVCVDRTSVDYGTEKKTIMASETLFQADG